MIVLLNRFTVHGDPETFEEVFAAVSDYMSDRPGFLAHRLVREAGDGAAYVNIAEWESLELLRRAVRSPEFEVHEDALAALATSGPVLHEVVLDRTAVAA
ncbi:antibiotic biosynthesis monooxygenase family protein [Actinomycetospora sp. NBRC 106378]|jgi:heme-degrading monooxygenase HmoA|uniref:antibiotic biosynthesis monooxygenase family protein n=1 Tax=Actinomycetospora sp. NBRC 106378 TaxID=3032208 RepID=UPI0024A2D4A0|nr:antibiotic biosynthesis monooxygenase family protein [Actinomycetospora sp. NBRC 106378]GLZ55380.1 hypothetical protein Acsp07_49970 [Actinomycetospora sp. NBRC 106378]